MKKTVFVLVAVVAVIIAVMGFGVREKEQATVINIACFPNITHAQA